MCLNKLKTDLLAVAYGQFEFGKQLGGLVLIWSLKNPEVFIVLSPSIFFCVHANTHAHTNSSTNINTCARAFLRRP